MIFVVYYPDTTSHLAIGLTGLGQEKNIYISFFPPNLSSKAGFRLHQLDHDRFIDDKKTSSRAATVIVLPTEESCGYGLSEQGIYDWWSQFNTQQESFSWLTNNCSSIVYRALVQAQRKSASLQQRLLVEKSWFCTPSNVLSYAKSLGEKLPPPQTLQSELLHTFTEIKAFCELGQKREPFGQVCSLYLRIKQFAEKNISLMLNRRFCIFVQDILREFKQQDKQTEIPTVDICYQQLNQLFKTVEKNQDAKAVQRLQKLIADKLLAPMAAYIDIFFLPQMYHDRGHIAQALDDASHVIDETKNPKNKHVQRSDPSPIEYRYGTITRF